MMTIWKFTEQILSGIIAYSMPADAKVVFAYLEGGELTVWAEVNPGEPAEEHLVAIVGTGHDIPVDGHYVCTQLNGQFVWHVYDIRSVTE